MRKWPRITKALIAVGLVLTISTQVYATSLDDAQQDKKDAEDNKSQAEKILTELESKKSDIETYVSELDTQMADIQNRINDLNNQKSELETQITQKQADLETAKSKEQKQYADMCARIQFMYENNEASYADAFLTSESMSDILNRPEYISAISEYDYNMLEQLVATREQIANDEQQLQMDLASAEELKTQAEAEQDTVNSLIDAKSKEIAEYDDLISRQEKLVAQYDAELQAASSRIAQLEAAARNSGNFVPYSGGALTWPCPSSTRLTSYFGYRTPDGGYVNANHKGIDIGAPTGTPAVAAASGVVVISRYSNSAGNWVVISHGNGLYTMYMHGSQLCVSEGQYVNAGDTVLLVGSTGWSTGPHLHFGVGVGGYTSAYAVDPLSYFQ